MTYKFNLTDLAKLCGCSRATIQRRMREQKVKLHCLPSMIRFLYPTMVIQSDKGIDSRRIWREILADRLAKKEDRSTEQRLKMLKNIQKPANDSLDQSVDFDFNQE